MVSEVDRYCAYRKLVQWMRCAICGEAGADSVDHRIPLAAGGTNAPSNLQPVHLRCNLRKGAKSTHKRDQPEGEGKS